jgi:flagellar biosynthesis protein FliQ
VDGHLSDLWHQAWRLGITLVVPTLAIPVVSFVFAIVFGLLGVRDEGVAYALRVVVLVGVGVLCAPIVASSLVTLMAQALR